MNGGRPRFRLIGSIIRDARREWKTRDSENSAGEHREIDTARVNLGPAMTAPKWIARGPCFAAIHARWGECYNRWAMQPGPLFTVGGIGRPRHRLRTARFESRRNRSARLVLTALEQSSSWPTPTRRRKILISGRPFWISRPTNRFGDTTLPRQCGELMSRM